MGGNIGADEDAKRYRDGYPGQREEEDPAKRDNQQFYANKLKSVPDGDYIEGILSKWHGNYSLLEQHHGYIQWLFPIREFGMNSESQPLTAYEADEMRVDPEVRQRLIRSYRLMLDFYGMHLQDEETGAITRKAEGWQERYRNLRMRGHNYLRITRIIKCLGELGLPQYQVPWCEHFVQEVFAEGQLQECADSLVRYWIPVVKDDEGRQRLLDEVGKYVDFGSKGKGKGK
mmetsp:Transcript_111535/g.310603  ORF Transcript_111535/g.310603 Transcript_111535/m.310603 type:complete len:230 (-) Transcript_111535:150-839(-)